MEVIPMPVSMFVYIDVALAVKIFSPCGSVRLFKSMITADEFLMWEHTSGSRSFIL
jgi:hypothetical protein